MKSESACKTIFYFKSGQTGNYFSSLTIPSSSVCSVTLYYPPFCILKWNFSLWKVAEWQSWNVYSQDRPSSRLLLTLLVCFIPDLEGLFPRMKSLQKKFILLKFILSLQPLTSSEAANEYASCSFCDPYARTGMRPLMHFVQVTRQLLDDDGDVWSLLSCAGWCFFFMWSSFWLQALTTFPSLSFDLGIM